MYIQKRLYTFSVLRILLSKCLNLWSVLAALVISLLRLILVVVVLIAISQNLNVCKCMLLFPNS